MKTLTKKKTYMGNVELRDYEVDKLLAYNQPVRVNIGDEYMILTPAQLKKGTVINTQQSIITKGQTYRLIGYPWRPKRDTDEQVTINFETKSKLSDLWKEVVRSKGL